jgi:TatD DNase family protein
MNSDIPFIDLHTHQVGNKDSQVWQVVNLMAGEQPPDGERFLSLGIHPWQLLHEKDTVFEYRFIRQLNLQGLVAIGEAGLDRAIGLPLYEQIPVFVMQARLAAALGLPLIIHAVRTIPELIELRKKIRDAGPWIIHGFNGQPEAARQLLQHGFYLSFGEALLQNNSKAAAAIREVPSDRLFLETDESESSIHKIYEQASILLSVNPDEIKTSIFRNFGSIFRMSEQNGSK